MNENPLSLDVLDEVLDPIKGQPTVAVPIQIANWMKIAAAFGGHKFFRPRNYVSTYEHVLRIKYPASAGAIIDEARRLMEDGACDRYDHALKQAEAGFEHL